MSRTQKNPKHRPKKDPTFDHIHRVYFNPTNLAKERDEYRCQWHLVVLEQIRPGAHGHHLFRPKSLYNETKYIVTLCEECHTAMRHTKGVLTDKMIIEQVMIPYVWGGEDLSPRDNKIKGA